MNKTESDAQFLTRSDFARLKGWNRSYISKLGDQGRLVLSPDGKLVNVHATLALLDKSADPGKTHVAQRHAADRVDRDVGQYVRPDAPGDAEPSGAGSGDPGYWESKARRESALADMAELELQARLKKLVDRALVESTVEALHRTLRDALMGLPTRLAPEFSSMTDAFEIEVKLRDALRALLTDLSKKTAQDLRSEPLE